MRAWKFSEYRWMKNRKNLAIVVAIALLLCLLGGVTAAYVWKNVSYDNQLTARRFYFTVDQLGDTNEDSQLTRTFDLYGGNTKNFAFRVQNYFDSERVSQVEAHYTVSVGSASTYTKDVKITSDGADVSSSTSFSLGMSNTAHKDYNVVIPAGYNDGDTVVVKVTANKPYYKDMSLVLKLHTSPAQVSYYVEDNAGDPYAKLYVMTTAQLDAGDLVVDWSGYNSTANTLQLDMTNPYFVDDVSGTLSHNTNNPGANSGSYLVTAKNTKVVNAGGSFAVMFFKADPSQDYSMGDDTQFIPAQENNGVFTVYIPKKN